jgi:tetratricopeptide (TPR) repeat protein
MLANTILLDDPNKKEETRKYFLKTLQLLNQAKKENKTLRLKYQKDLPLIIKSYGLDYNSIPVKIAYLEAYTRCNNLYEPFTVGIRILKPYMERPAKVDPVTLDLYTHLLLLDKQHIEAKRILLIANSVQPHLSVILLTLFEIAVKFENDGLHAEKYLLEAFKYYPYETAVLERALVFYEGQKNLVLKTKFAYLLGLRTRLKPAYQEAMYGFLDLGQLKEAKKTITKLMKIDPNDSETLYLLNRYQMMKN